MRVSFTLLLASAASLHAADPGEEFFEKKIRPVLAAKCYACHSGALKEPAAGLRLDTHAGLTNKKILPAITYQNLDLKMPPTGKLPGEVIADFRRWAEMGSPAPADRAPAPSSTKNSIDWQKAREFWAFQPVRRPDLPAVKDTAWPRTPIDRFLLARLEANDLHPAAEATKRAWLRRVTFDLTGLPPTRTELAAFLLDESEGAHEKVVDRLLRSPQYGERWARHWLDLVRFAETNGHEFDNTKQDAWQYRDYVIRALNQDLPYDRFVREQIAGDLLPEARLSEDGAFLESPIGTGIYWFGEVLNSATDSVKSRADQVDNQLDVVSKTFLGLTVACARCHDHKFDPIPTADYYSLAGILHSTGIRETVIDSPLRRAEIINVASILESSRPRRIDPWQPRPGDDLFEDFTGTSFGNWTPAGQAFGAAPVQGAVTSAGIPALSAVGSLTSQKFTMPKLWVHIRMRGTKFEGKRRDDLRVTVVADEHKSINFYPTGKDGWEWRSGRMTKEIGRTCFIEIVDRALDGYIAVDKIIFSDNEKPPEEEFSPEPWPLNTVRLPPSQWAMVARDENPANVKLHIRGNHKNLGDEVPRGVLQIVGDTRPAVAPRSSGRLALAQWITDPANPLTARVMVNRIWKHHFGHGLVRTPDNFGKTGERPSHPELLDWLAASFVENGWSIKKLQKQIVLSSAYRMSSRPTPTGADPRNDLLSYMPVQRLEGEAIRDAMLAISGRLSPEMYGPSIVPHISKYQDGRGKPEAGPLDGAGRRSIYIQVRRNFLTPLFLAFDYPLPISTIGSRSVSTVPSQALLMMNNELVADLATTWGRNVAISGVTIEAAIKKMYEEAFAREPEEWETKAATAFIAKQLTPVTGLTEFAQVLFNSAEFIYVQ
jgi:hypothetical protein